MQRFTILVAILYITFIGGTAYTTNNMILRIVYHVLVTAAVGLWLINLIRKQRAWPHTPFDAPLFVFAILLFTTTLASKNVRVSLEQIWPFLMHIVWFYISVSLMQQGRQRWIFEALFMAVGVFIIISVVEVISWYFGMGFAGFEQGWFQIGGLSDPFPPVLYEISLALNLGTIVGNYAALLLPVVFAWSLTARQADHRFGLKLLSIGLLWILIGSGSRGSVVALAGAALTMTAFWLTRQERYRPLLRPILTGLAMAIITLGTLVLVIAFLSSSTSDQRRVDMWESALSMVKDDPLTGVGVYQFGTEYRFTRDKTLIQDKMVAAHNLWLNTTAEIGLPGFIVMLWLGGVFLKVWWCAWKREGRGRQIRLEGILAALVGFCLHSLIDTFTLSASVVPILIYTAYVTAGEYTPYHRVENKPSPAVYRAVSYVALIVVVGFFVWLVRVDIAAIRHMNSLVQLGKENYEASLDYLHRAQSADPHLGLYELQEAYVLGLMAEENPDTYLDKAIQAHLDTLKGNPTFDTGYANLAALYAQKGEFEKAVENMQKAVNIHPDLWEYWLKLAEYQEKAGEEDDAVKSYVEAMGLNIGLAHSEYWKNPTPVQEKGLMAAYETVDPGQKMLLAVYLNRAELADRAAAQIDPESSYYALANYERFRGNNEAALVWYDKAVEAGSSAIIYAERAELHLEMGNHKQAEKDARTAIFLNKVDGARAYYVLALVSDENAETINQYLINAVVPEITVQEYAATVYARPALLNYLPQLKIPGQGREAYEPWFLLAERYASDDDEDTDPADVYEAIYESEPHLES